MLVRRGGLALLFLMPVCLVCIMALVQDAPFRDFSEQQVHVLFRDLDGGSVGSGIKVGLEKAGPFVLTDVTADGTVNDSVFHDLVRSGDYQVGIVVPMGASEVMRVGSQSVVTKFFDPANEDDSHAAPNQDSAFVKVLVDPVVKGQFVNWSRASWGAFSQALVPIGFWPI